MELDKVNETRFGGSLTITNSQITDNTAGDDASAIDFYNSVDLTIVNSEISGNRSNGTQAQNFAVGAIRVIDIMASPNGATHALFDNVSIIDNHVAHDSGNGLGAGASFGSHAGDQMTVEFLNSSVSGNAMQTGHNSGGAGLYVSGMTTVTLRNSTVTGNHGSTFGGGIGLGGFNTQRYAELIVIDSVISQNRVQNSYNPGHGAGIRSFHASVTLTGSTLSDNSAETSGGGMSVFGSLVLTNSTVSGNTAGSSSGGGISFGGNYYYGFYLDITQSTISGNSAAKRRRRDSRNWLLFNDYAKHNYGQHGR